MNDLIKRACRRLARTVVAIQEYNQGAGRVGLRLLNVDSFDAWNALLDLIGVPLDGDSNLRQEITAARREHGEFVDGDHLREWLTMIVRDNEHCNIAILADVTQGISE